MVVPQLAEHTSCRATLMLFQEEIWILHTYLLEAIRYGILFKTEHARTAYLRILLLPEPTQTLMSITILAVLGEHFFQEHPFLMAIQRTGFVIMFLQLLTVLKSPIREVSVRIQLTGEMDKPVMEL